VKILQAELAAVAVRRAQYPPDDRAEIAFAGRSNVGKSSLLNLLTGRRRLAHVSGSPGKTRTINFYDVSFRGGSGGPEEETHRCRIVDLPGYGYAKVSRSVSDSWGEMMDEYFRVREGLIRVVQLVDLRHPPTVLDRQMYAWLQESGLDGLVAATKADKVAAGQRAARLAEIRSGLRMAPHDIVVAVSALKKTGCTELLEEIERLLYGEAPCQQERNE
jgi:GTP-binding protein